MLRTIAVGSCVSVQGIMIGQMPDGKIMVKVDDKTFVGMPVPAARAA
ncbi:hypothetical protein [Tabrizicola sp.]|jgi:hypothetical protein